MKSYYSYLSALILYKFCENEFYTYMRNYIYAKKMKKIARIVHGNCIFT